MEEELCGYCSIIVCSLVLVFTVPKLDSIRLECGNKTGLVKEAQCKMLNSAAYDIQ